MSTDVLLSVRDVRVDFRVARGWWGRWQVLHAVDGVSFDIAAGATLGLVGESGCGKTTLGRVLLGLIPAAGGTVRFNQIDVLQASRGELRRLRRQMQIVFQDPYDSLNPRMRIGQSIAEPLEIHRIGTRAERRLRARALLERVGLQAEDALRYPHEFSGGQRQRIGIARALALEPKFIVCDEPVSALDVSVQAQIINLLKGLQDELGLTYLFIAHNLAVVRHVSQQVAVMYRGRIVEIADRDDLFERPRHPYTLALLAAVPQPDPAKRLASTSPGGEPPSLFHAVQGCAFHPRCPFATQQCRDVAPALDSKPGLSATHQVACHHADGTLVAAAPDSLQ